MFPFGPMSWARHELLQSLACVPSGRELHVQSDRRFYAVLAAYIGLSVWCYAALFQIGLK